MWNQPTQERLDKLPRLYETENIPLKEKLIHLKFFIGSCTWLISEFDGEDLLWGFCHLGDDTCAEWGYVSFKELQSIKVNGWVEVDCELEEHFSVRPASEFEIISRSSGWS